MANAFRYKFSGLTNSLKTKVTISTEDGSAEVVALWDTGATLCCVSEDVVNKLSLQSTGKARMSTPSSIGDLVDTYSVNLLLPNDLLVKDVVVAHSKIGSQGIGLLVGMDIISRGDFLVTNKGQTIFSFRTPSELTADFATGIDLRNIMGAPHGNGKKKRKKK